MLLSFTDFLNPEFYIEHGGLWLILFIIFAETGLMIGFLLPGDSILFVAGIYSEKLIKNLLENGTGSELLNLLVLLILIAIFGTIGNMAGYWFGMKSGELLYHRKDTFLFKKRNLMRAKKFYDLHGAQAIIYTRFLPIVRTFGPIVGGAVKMEKKKFLIYSIIGIGALAAIMLFGGHYLNMFFIEHFEYDLKTHLNIIVVCIVLVTTLPVFIKWYITRNKTSS